MSEFSKSQGYSTQFPALKVLGLGGGGCNAINRMIELGISGVEFLAANTDYQALQTSLASQKIQLGPNVTRGLGAGGNPDIGRQAAEESERAIADALEGADMVFLTAGMGGGTGTGSIPVAARIARSMGAVTIAIVTSPFSFEMGRRQRNANQGMAELAQHTDTLIAIPNDRLLMVAPRDLPLEVAFRLADDVLRQAVQGITELITEPGMINVDFAHVRRLMKIGGGAFMSIGHGKGLTKARSAVEQALDHPLLEEISINQAAGIIANFTGGDDLTLFEVSEVLNELHARVGDQAEIVFGVTHDDRMQGRAQVILVITGLGAPTLEEVMPGISLKIEKANAKHQAQEARSIPGPASAAPVEIAEHFQAVPAGIPQTHSDNLDIPAFLRRRSR
ncbi:MAG TPA: cell division protein FtsZ [Anaerolineales bacterium]|nr:cell division protein FtsZ [Anaerolineales bacterium]